MYKHNHLAIALVLILLLSACSTPTPPAPELPPNEILRRAGAAMLEQSSMHFKIDIDGAAAPINPALGLGLRSAEGDFLRPDRIGVHLKIISPIVSIEADMIALGDEQYVTNFLTQAWEPLPAQFGFNPAVMFHPEFGLERTLAEGLDDASNVGVESLDGVQVYHVRGSVSGDRLQAMSGGLISTGRIDVEVWAEVESFLVRQTVLVDNMTATNEEVEPSTWTLSFSKFGDTVSIDVPID